MSKQYIVFSDELRASTEALITDNLKGRIISRDKLANYISVQVDILYDIKNWITRVDIKGRRQLVKTVLNAAKKDISGLGAYVKFRKLLIKQAKNDSDTILFEELVKTIDKYADALDFLESKLTELFPEKNISMMNTKPRTLALFGLLDTISKLSLFTEMAMHTVVSVIVDERATSKYIQNLLGRDIEIAASLVNNVYDNNTEINLVETINNISDVVGQSNVITSDMTVNVSEFGKVRLSGLEGIVAKHAINNFSNIFLPIWETINTLRNNALKRRAERTEWMRSQVELLTRKLDGMDESDQEYKRLKKVVDKYNDMIEKRLRKEEKRNA